jgi:hypothetical protein
MATLVRLVLRFAAVIVLTFAIAGLAPRVVRAQSSDSQPEEAAPQAAGQPAAEAASPAVVSAPAPDTKSAASEAKPDASAPSSHESSAAAKDSLASPNGGTAQHEKNVKSGRYELDQAVKQLSVSKRPGDDVFRRATQTFPAFCKDWERRLHDRELNNLESMTWKDKDGYKTGTYLAYSPIKSCNCKRSTGGVPIGELTYQETEYFLEGKTPDDARHAQPKPVGITNTTEIFRWDRNKWDDGR